MAKQRYVNTKFWSDNYISSLDIVERYLFLYFLTNEHTNIAGIYELPMRNMCTECGLDKEQLEKILPRFAGKIHYIDGWVYMKNFQKHQSQNPSVVDGVKRVLSDVPSHIMEEIERINSGAYQTGYSLTPSSHILNSTLPYSTQPNLTEISEQPVGLTPKDQAIKFFQMVEEENGDFLVFLENLNREYGIPIEAGRREVKKFVSYWTEPTASGKKQLWQTKKTFEVKRRLATWLSNAGKWSKGPNITSKYQVNL